MPHPSEPNPGNTNHNQNFKELISTFFLEFLELFVPELAEAVDPESIRFLPQEYFADLVGGDEKIIDLLVEVKLAGEDTTFLCHIEAQSYRDSQIARRMFYYLARLHQNYVKNIYPIVIFSFDYPYRAESNLFEIEFPHLKVLEFRFQAIQLNQLNWRDYLDRPNPVAAALMAKMKIAKRDRPQVKAECLRLLVTLKLDPAKTRLISKFVDTYLRLNIQEEQRFQAEIDRLGIAEKEAIMQLTTSWEEKGIEKGIEKERRSLISLLLNQKLGQLPPPLQDRLASLSLDQLAALATSLLNFNSLDDLTTWLDQHPV
ncbi:Rpn family recombination-promoting nuclease/putative transposase [Alkalinema pantanalense CENA528]|uniref:Rpn family recombination-promoting nuclease/putative transposase n=1 Tax=Alkalinema pantanalense TaxID=1620705 RepID=UPI003D6F067F